MSVGEQSGAAKTVVPKGATKFPDVFDFEKDKCGILKSKKRPIGC